MTPPAQQSMADRAFDLHATHAVRFGARALRTLPRLADGRRAVASRLDVADGADGVHLSFDDGPSPATTTALLDALGGVRSTFFLLADAVREHPGLARRIADGGHRIGLHGPTHADLWRTRFDDRAWDAARAEIEDASGKGLAAVRPPFGHLTPPLLGWARRACLPVWLWDVMPGDFRPGATAASVAAAVHRLARPGSLVVLHEGPAVAPVLIPAVARLVRP